MKQEKDSNNHTSNDDAAANLIRTKLDKAYSVEPSVKQESEEINNLGAKSKHQLYMKQLLNSGRNYLDIQAAWHSYYLSLTDDEKHDVWREFYMFQNRQNQMIGQQQEHIKNSDQADNKKTPRRKKLLDTEVKSIGVKKLKNTIIKKITADGKLGAKQHFKSLLFGIGVALVFALVTGFTLFNQLFIGPFITPSINASATPIIAAIGNIAVPPEPKVIIPKLNVEAPLVTEVADGKEATIQKALQKGVVLYPNTGKPGELGNQVIFGHSSNNLFNSGDYKFVFVLLSRMEKGDIIYINYLSKQYTYKVIDKKTIKPTEVSILSEQPVPALITLITCDPPGANVNRLVIQAEQINPSPAENKTSTAQISEQPTILAGSPESLWRRIINSIFR